MMTENEYVFIRMELNKVLQLGRNTTIDPDKELERTTCAGTSPPIAVPKPLAKRTRYRIIESS